MVTAPTRFPSMYDGILEQSRHVGFSMNSDVLTGTLLRALAASKPGGALLELGTGCGLGTTWLLDGMTADARLTTVDTDDRYQSIARAALGSDSRVTFHLGEGGTFLENCGSAFDLIYADAWPGKYSHLDAALRLLKTSGIYVVDDMLPQLNWPSGHAPAANALRERLHTLNGFIVAALDWSTGLIICVKHA
jgi:predicted O-methyltransferase YrrM